jgi:hypothetical protein
MFTSLRVRVDDRCAAALVGDVAPAQMRLVTMFGAAEDRTQFDPFQVKFGNVGAALNARAIQSLPVTALQTTVDASPSRAMSNPFSFIPPQLAEVAFTLVLVHVRIAPRTICVAVKRPTGGRPLSPGGP